MFAQISYNENLLLAFYEWNKFEQIVMSNRERILETKNHILPFQAKLALIYLWKIQLFCIFRITFNWCMHLKIHKNWIFRWFQALYIESPLLSSKIFIQFSPLTNIKILRNGKCSSLKLNCKSSNKSRKGFKWISILCVRTIRQIVMCDSLRKMSSSCVTSLQGMNEDVQCFVDSKFAKSILSQLYGFYDKGKFTDFELISGDRLK